MVLPFILAAATGAIIAGTGKNISKAHSEITNSLKASIESSQKSMTSTSTSVSCSNVQELVGVKGCTVNFAEQTCNLDALTKSVSNMNLLNNVSQDVLQSLKNAASAQSSGLPVGTNSSESSAIIKSMVDVSQKSVQTLATDCSRDASAVNVQSFRDSSCTEKNVINFAAQKTSLSLISECVVDQAASNVATQKLTSLIDNASSATSKGLDMFAFFGIFIMLMGFLLFFPVVKRFITGISSSTEAQQAALTPPDLPAGIKQDLEDRKNAKSAVAYLLLGLVVMVLFFWPGMFAGLSGIWPWPSKLPLFDGQQTCKVDDDGNGFVDESSVINKFGFTDPMCTTGDKGQQECKTIISYKECGIFSGKCNDPEYISARSEYDKAIKACGALTNSPFEYCRPQDISNVLFAKQYPECKRCENDANNPLWHSHVGKDQSCDPTKIDLFTYMGTEDQGCKGGSELGYCLDTKEALLQKSPNDCTDPGYQLRKKQLSYYLRACEQVKATSRIKSDLVSARCPPPMSAYFTKCSTDTNKCNYAALGCVCDSTGKNCDCSKASNQEAVGACRNDFTNCLDTGYIADVKMHTSINQKCADVRKQEQTANFLWPAIFGSIYFIMILAMIFFAYSAFKTRSPEVQQAHLTVQKNINNAHSKEETVSSFQYKLLFVLMLLLLFAFIPPAGMLAIAKRSPPLWDGNKTKNSAWFDGIDKIDVTSLEIGGYIGASLCAVVMVFCLFKIFALSFFPQTKPAAAT